MWNRIHAYLQSEKAMSVVNLLFFFSLLIRNQGVIFVAYALWIVYLGYCIKASSSKTVRIVLGLLCAFAAFMIAANLYVMLR